MAGLNALDTVEIGIEGLIAGQKTLNVLHYSVLVASTPLTYTAAMTNLLNDYLNSLTGPLLPILAAAAQNWTCVRIRGQRVWPTRDIALFVADGRPGQRPFNAEACNLAATISKFGSLANRHNIGSLHLAGLSSADYAASLITNAQLLRMDNIRTRLQTDLAVFADTTTAKNIIYSRPNPALYTPIVATTNQPTVRVMRRRTVGVGK